MFRAAARALHGAYHCLVTRYNIIVRQSSSLSSWLHTLHLPRGCGQLVATILLNLYDFLKFNVKLTIFLIFTPKFAIAMNDEVCDEELKTLLGW